MDAAFLERRAPLFTRESETRRVRAGEAVVNLVLGAGLAVMKEGKRFQKLGLVRWKDYCKEQLGMTSTCANDMIFRAQALRERPILLRPLVEGRLDECAATELLKHLPTDGSRDAEWLDSDAMASLPRLKRCLEE